jgi:hypothetical protein
MGNYAEKLVGKVRKNEIGTNNVGVRCQLFVKVPGNN